MLVIEPEVSIAQRLLGMLGRPCCAWSEAELEARITDNDGARQRPGGQAHCRCADRNGAAPCSAVLSSLRQLHETDLARWGLVVCAIGLPDASGLDALAYIRGVRPDLPVILTADGIDTALAVEAIRAGALDFMVTSGEQLSGFPLAVEKCLAHQRIKQENERLHRELARFLGEFADKNVQLQRLINHLQTMARTDELTGLCNRRWLNEMLERAWAEAVRHGTPLAFVMMDLDGFKVLNDKLGHQRGDALLRLTGKVIQANCRQVDIAARYGGDEFCILMPQTEAHEAVRVAQRIGQELEHALRDTSSSEPRIAMSVGLSHINLSRPANADQLITHADEAMYAAKASRDHRIMLYDADGAFTPASRLAARANASAAA